MTDRIDALSDRARWFLNNFDEIALADLCAAHEASNQAREAVIERVRALADRWEAALPGQPHHGFAEVLRAALDGPEQPSRTTANNPPTSKDTP